MSFKKINMISNLLQYKNAKIPPSKKKGKKYLILYFNQNQNNLN